MDPCVHNPVLGTKPFDSNLQTELKKKKKTGHALSIGSFQFNKMALPSLLVHFISTKWPLCPYWFISIQQIFSDDFLLKLGIH